MQTIHWTRGNETGSKRVHDFALQSTLAAFRAAGYTIVEDAPAGDEITPAAEQTGRVGKGREIHRIVGGGAQCGSSYRRGLGANSAIKVTGEEITCAKCRAI